MAMPTPAVPRPAQKAESSQYILTISCPDTIGIVAAVSGFLAKHGCFINESSHFGDTAVGGDTTAGGDTTVSHFFMRTVFTTKPDAWKDLEDEFRTIAGRFGMEWQAHHSAVRQRVVILVSKADHCLSDLLYRYRTKQLHMHVPAIISNHPDLAPLANWHEIPFHHLPVTPQTKPEQEQRLSRLIEEYDADVVVLARYMQILSPALCETLKGRAINIHHSFLPSFKGARPYHQAHERGVKLIGATAHYVTPNLDEGPIIEQAAERVDHTFTPRDLIAVGRDIENVVLARALRYHLEHRVLRNGIRTVVFR